MIKIYFLGLNYYTMTMTAMARVQQDKHGWYHTASFRKAGLTFTL